MTDGGASLAALADSDGNVRMLIRPNRSLSPQEIRLLFVAASAVLLTVGVGFALIGAWLVLPFAGLEIAIIAVVLRWMHRHLDDHELIVITDRSVRVLRCAGDQQSETEFNRYWVRVAVTPGDMRSPSQVRIGSHGRFVEVGAEVSEATRKRLAQELKRLLAR